METIYKPQEEKHYTLEDWMIRGVINGKMLQWQEREELHIKLRSKPRSAMDRLLDRPEWPSKTNFEAFLNMLSDENLNDLVFLAGALNVAILSVIKILAEDDLQRPTEMLSNLINILTILACKLIIQIGCLHTGTVPIRRKSRTYNTLSVNSLWNNAKESL